MSGGVAASRIIAAARRSIDTRFRHQGRQPGAGLDCGGLIVCAYHECGARAGQVRRYSRLPQPDQLIAAIEQTHAYVSDRADDIRPADVLLFRISGTPQHVAMATDRDQMIHAYLSNRRVVEHRIDDGWRAALAGIYRSPGVISSE